MSRSEVLALLRQDEYISGEEISRQLGVSRAAVWKAVRALRAEGCRIDSVPNRGYCLRPAGRLNAALLQAAPWSVVVPEEVDSTNNIAKQLGTQGAPHGTVVVTERQTGGRGRLGRSFVSPPGGVYLSVLLRPELPLERLMHLTALAAVATRRAIDDCCGLAPDIKWMNDLLWQDKKLCGILTELSIQVETREVDYVVAGIGINCNQTAFPPELQEVATSLRLETGCPVDRSRLANAMVGQFQTLARELLTDKDAWLAEFSAHCVTLGRQVQVIRGDAVREAVAEGIDESAALLVRYPDGTREAVSSGEVSVRGMYGYLD